MSLYAEYVKERWGNEVLETEHVFLEFEIKGTDCVIANAYCSPQKRSTPEADETWAKMIEIAKQKGCTKMWCQVDTTTLNANHSLRAILGRGFKVDSAASGIIILSKDIGG